MKKRNVHFLMGFSLFILFILTSCPSVPSDYQEFDPFTLFDENASLYMSVPVIDNESFVRAFVTAWMPTINSKSVEMILERTDIVYIAVFIQQGLLSRESTYFQLAAYGSFPTFFVNASLNQKNGWHKITEKVDGVTYKRKKDLSGFEIAMPTSNFVIASNHNVLSMQQRYEQPQRLVLNWPSTLNESGTKADIRMFLNDSASMAVYMPTAGSLLPSMIGAPIELAIDYAFGTITPYDENTAILNLQLQMRNERATKITMALFGMAARMVSFVAEEKQNNVVILDDLIVDSAFLLGLIE